MENNDISRISNASVKRSLFLFSFYLYLKWFVFILFEYNVTVFKFKVSRADERQGVNVARNAGLQYYYCKGLPLIWDFQYSSNVFVPHPPVLPSSRHPFSAYSENTAAALSVYIILSYRWRLNPRQTISSEVLAALPNSVDTCIKQRIKHVKQVYRAIAAFYLPFAVATILAGFETGTQATKTRISTFYNVDLWYPSRFA